MDEVTCAKPGGNLNASMNRQWIPYTSSASAQTSAPLIDYVEEVSRQRVLLCEIMAPLGHNL
jgi:hypothetical protein